MARVGFTCSDGRDRCVAPLGSARRSRKRSWVAIALLAVIGVTAISWLI